MIYKIGDRVKFIAEEGGGIIRSVIGINLVNVETEDGFEIPTLTRDIILVAPTTAAERLFVNDIEEETKSEKIITEESPSISMPDQISQMSSLIVYPSDRKPELFHVSIAFVPQQQHMPVVGELDIYLMNFSSHEILFSFHIQNEEVIQEASSGKVAAFSKWLIKSIAREDLEAYLNAHIQVLVLQYESKILLAPISSEMQIRGSKFYKDSAYQRNQFLHQNAILYQLFEFRNIPIISQLKAGEEAELHQTKAKIARKSDEILKHKTEKDEAVVDMHIWELVDDHSRMTNGEMLNIQLGYFSKCLQSAIDHNFKKVVFIHGVGTGKLKEELKLLLDEMDYVKYRPASMAEFGVGATLVEISNLGSSMY